MGDSVIEQYWNIVNRFEDLLCGGEKSEDAPCPIEIPLYPPTTAFNLTYTASKILYIGISSVNSLKDKSHFLTNESFNYFEKWLNSINLSTKENCSFFVLENQIQKEDFLFQLDQNLLASKPKLILVSDELIWDFIYGQGSLSLENGIIQSFSKSFEYKGVPLFPIYHPKVVIENSQFKRAVWDILKQIKKLFEIE